METEKFLNRLEETLSQVVRQQEAICAELVSLRESVAELGENKADEGGGAPTREELLTFLDQFRAGEALGEASTKAWVEASDVACVKGGLRVVAEREGKVMVGYRNYPEGPMQEVQTLLDEIVREAVGK